MPRNHSVYTDTTNETEPGQSSLLVQNQQTLRSSTQPLGTAAFTALADSLSTSSLITPTTHNLLHSKTAAFRDHRTHRFLGYKIPYTNKNETKFLVPV